MSYRLGIDLGGTSAKVAVVSAAKKIVHEISVPTAGFPQASKVAEKIGVELRSVFKRYSVSNIGIGVSCDIDSAKGIVRVSPNLGWKNVPLKKLFSRYVRCEVRVDNDANAAAWGLYHTQAPKNVRNVIVMTLGTGVGGGLIIDGKLHQGATGSAGEIGHLNIEEDGPRCNCGYRGCLETYVGGPHLVKRVRSALERGQRSSLQRVYKNNPKDITPFALSKAALRGDAFAKSVWQGVGHALGVAVGDLVYLLNPEMIFFTGGIAQAEDLILKPLWQTLNRRAFKTPIKAVKIKIAKDASQVGVIGASLL